MSGDALIAAAVVQVVALLYYFLDVSERMVACLIFDALGKITNLGIQVLHLFGNLVTLLH